MSRSHARLLGIEIGIVLALVAALEIGLRWYVGRTPDFPLPRLFGSSVTTGKYLAFRAADWRDQPLDLLFLGMSPMMRVDGRQLRERLDAGGERNVRTFNFSGPLQTVEFNRLLLDEIVLPDSQPEVVVYGVVPIDLLRERSRTETAELAYDLPAFELHGGGLAPLRLLLDEQLALLRYRQVLRDWLAGDLEEDPWSERVRRTDRFGDIELLETNLAVRLNNWDRRYAKKFEDFERLMRESPLFDHLAGLARFCRDRDIRLVIVNAPVHPLFLELLPRGQRSYDRFVRRLREVAIDNDVAYFDPAGGRPGEPELFKDSHHLDRDGGEWFTDRLAEFLIAQDLI